MDWRMQVGDARWKLKSIDPMSMHRRATSLLLRTPTPGQEVATASIAREILEQPPPTSAWSRLEPRAGHVPIQL